MLRQKIRMTVTIDPGRRVRGGRLVIVVFLVMGVVVGNLFSCSIVSSLFLC
jgi:hypothetical protein